MVVFVVDSHIYNYNSINIISVQNQNKRDASVTSADSESSSRTHSGSRSSFVNPQRGKTCTLGINVLGHMDYKELNHSQH